MRYFDPARPRGVNKLPVWKDAKQVVLPRINLIPDEEGRWRISLTVPIGDWGFDEASRIVELGEVEEILSDWEADPEGALSKWWGRRISEKSGRTSEKAVSGVKQVAREALDL